MGGNTGNIRGQRNQSSCNGSKTFGSIVAGDCGNGAGSFRRIHSWYIRNHTTADFYKNEFNLTYGKYKYADYMWNSNNLLVDIIRYRFESLYGPIQDKSSIDKFQKFFNYILDKYRDELQ